MYSSSLPIACESAWPGFNQPLRLKSETLVSLQQAFAFTKCSLYRYAEWCNSCRRLYPRLTKLAGQEQDVLFVKIDFDECKDLCRKLGVVKLPYFHVYNGSGSRLADFASSLDPAKFKRLTDAIEENRTLRCALPVGLALFTTLLDTTFHLSPRGVIFQSKRQLMTASIV